MEKPEDKEVVTLSVSSVVFSATRATLNSIDGSLLSKLDKSSEYFDHNQSVYTFDRDPDLFRHILNIHRNREIHFPRNVCPILFKKELEFWKISIKLIAPCCWNYLYDTEGNVENLQKVMEGDNEFNTYTKANNQIQPWQSDLSTTIEPTERGDGMRRSKKGTLGSKLWLFLEEPASSKAALIWCYFYICVAMVSVILYIIWLVPSLRVSRYLFTSEDTIDVLRLNETVYKFLVTRYNEKIILAGATDPHPVLLVLDVFCISFFTFEVLLSVCVCPDLKKYFTDGYNLIKIFVCICMIISLALELDKDSLYGNIRLARFAQACRCFNVLRLLLMFRLRKIYNGLHIMLLAVRHSLKELLLLLFTFLIAVVVYGCLIFSAEIETEMFPNTQISMWWALVTMTTVGYGDYFPVSSFGYIIGVMCAINGIIVLALPIAAIAGTFSNFFTRNYEFQKHKRAIKNQMQSETEDK